MISAKQIVIRRGIYRCVSTDAALQHCVELVKKHDFDSYLAGLLVPREKRGAFFSIKAFNVETAMIKDQVRNNIIAGKMRFNWWMTAVESINIEEDIIPADVLLQPVAQSLIASLKKKTVNKSWFHRSLESRLLDMRNEKPQTVEDLEVHVERVHSSILYLLLETMEIRIDEVNYAASHLGVASGIVTMLRAMPFNLTNSQSFLPDSLCEKYGIDLKRVGPPAEGAEAGAGGQGLQDAVFELATLANDHLHEARKLVSKGVPSLSLRVLGGPAVRSAIYLNDLQDSNFNIFCPRLNGKQQQHLKYQMQLLKVLLTRSI